MRYLLNIFVFILATASIAANANTKTQLESYNRIVALDDTKANRSNNSSSIEIIVKWKSNDIYQSLLRTPETQLIDHKKQLSALKKSKTKRKLNVKSSINRSIGLNALTSIYQITGLEIKHLRASAKQVDLLKVFTSESFEHISKELMATGYFIYINNNTQLTLFETSSVGEYKTDDNVETQSIDLNEYNDQLFGDQLYLQEQQPFHMGAHSILQAKEYTAQHKSLNRKVRVAVLDTGSWPHEDMNWSSEGVDMISGGYDDCASVDTTNSGLDLTCSIDDFIEKTRDSNPIDKGWLFDKDSDGQPISEGVLWIKGHGIEVASTISAISNNDTGIIGAVDHNDIELIPVRVINYAGASLIDVADAIYWASGNDIPGVPSISSPVDVINLSLTSNSLGCLVDSYIYEAINYARSKNVVIVAAAGNNFLDVETFSPATCAGVLTVSANNARGEILSLSNHGKKIDVTFQGEEIHTASIKNSFYHGFEWASNLCLQQDGTQGNSEQCYFKASGTSLAAPLASATAALVRLNNPEFTEGEIRQAIELTSAKYAVDEYGSPNLRASKMPNAGVGNAFKAINVNFDLTDLKTSEVTHHFKFHTEGAKQIYLEELIKLSGKNNVCNRYSASWGVFNNEVLNLKYELYKSNTSEEHVTSANSTLIPTFSGEDRISPHSFINMDGYTRLGVKACSNSACGEMLEFDFSEAQIPNLCLGVN